ncbi:hypothetical protein [Streptomyces acidiscabies]|uniref:Uncharacterized protein n=1 Tax=Streptomyces acidiscabies TaxID=42234 RepID=A0A0L0JEC9_9ACTN|nr:hypothetical protein [Streptomyces acidiscabies]KND23829.1 hypothetical protein IQ63_43675 [Streptomyces acidiscabies]
MKRTIRTCALVTLTVMAAVGGLSATAAPALAAPAPDDGGSFLGNAMGSDGIFYTIPAQPIWTAISDIADGISCTSTPDGTPICKVDDTVPVNADAGFRKLRDSA